MKDGFFFFFLFPLVVFLEEFFFYYYLHRSEGEHQMKHTGSTTNPAVNIREKHSQPCCVPAEGGDDLVY